MSWGAPQGYGGYGTGSAPPAYGQGQPYGQPGGNPYVNPSAPGYQQGPPGYGQPPPRQPPQGQPPGQAYGQQGPAGYGQYGGYGQQPPPAYGQAPPAYGAPQGYQQQGYNPTGGSYGPPPPPGVSQEMWMWFQAVDQDRSGKITAAELQQALLNGNWSPFNPETCRLMIGMFDKDRNGTIDAQEFAALWKYIQDWKACFDRFDTDRSGNIDAQELNTALRTFGYNLSPQFCTLVVRTFDRQGARNIKFDAFIQACVMLKTLTDKFRARDTQQNGVITISYEDFLEMVLDNTLVTI